MADRSFGPAWPECNRSEIRTLVRADGLRLPVHKDLVELVAILLDLTELSGYNVVPGQTWGFACRAIAGTSTPSNHSQGTAIDLNAPANPRRARGLPMLTDIPKAVRKLWTDHGFRWGGNFEWPDPMHFEFMGTAAQARQIAARLRRFLGSGTPTVGHVPSPADRPSQVGYPGEIEMHDTGRAVRTWQTALRERGYDIVVDGIFGKVTNHVLRDWQAKHGLKVDGIGGPRTWHSLLRA